MNCEQVKYQIIDFIDNAMDPEMKHKIEAHINSCESCQDMHIQTGKLLEGISNESWIQPSPNLRNNFYKMIETEKASSHVNTFKTKALNFQNFKRALSIAAQIIILIALGILIGTHVHNKKQYSQEINALQSEIYSLKNNVNLVALKQPSASERLQAINSVDNQEFNSEIFEALINTMNTDANVNVRMASMYALSKYSTNEMVKAAFIKSLKYQSDPLLQITLINILVNIQDDRAKEPIENIMNNVHTPEVVKQQAKTGLQAFI